ncbi:MAG: ATP-binding cassette domain-containing protein [Bacteroidales bacterium]|nr:ATP-binding cassette domain-containing protein [Bacteroidales bacterium]MBE6241698.1 ATP-binding cassette domain-containing protein [Bacteroidales bacterium]
MHSIRLKGVIPNVFNSLVPTDPVSDVWGTDLLFEKGQTYLIKAASGRGKSSLCSYIYGLRDDYEGQITFDDKPVPPVDSSKWNGLRQNELGVLFQDLRLFGDLTAVDNVMIKASLTSFCDEKKAVEMLCELGLSDRLDRPVRLLSFGQQQRVAFVRMLCQKADFWLLDEPVSHLDSANAAIMVQMLENEIHQSGTGLIVTTIGHDLPYGYDKVLML